MIFISQIWAQRIDSKTIDWALYFIHFTDEEFIVLYDAN